jgi:hypothetical protein
LRLLDIVSQDRKHEHGALWEEEKHYSWWIYVLFAGLIWVYANGHISVVGRQVIITLGGVLGMILAFFAFQAIRRESEYFHTSGQIRARIIGALRLNDAALMPVDYYEVECFELVKDRANKSVCRLIKGAYLEVRQFVTRELKDTRLRKDRRLLGIRDIFQFTFLVAALLFLALMIVSWATI